MTRRNSHLEDAPEYPGHYTVNGWRGVAFSVWGWETEPDDDTEWTGEEQRTGKLVAVMVGDDRRHLIDPEDLAPLKRGEFCGECGQIGCHCDGYDDSDD